MTQDWKKKQVEKISGEIINLVMNREANWTEKLDEYVSSLLDKAREEGREEKLLLKDEEIIKVISLSHQEERSRILKIIGKIMPNPMTTKERKKFHCEGAILHVLESLKQEINDI